ncbi:MULTISPECIES: hypothetical protein [unclassified Mesorhizobium]|uniref:hypothetical protein n=1 Tax=unclassified Mesorhizobium TaxID=325217 RepID=UPI001CD06559|nr:MULTISPECIES: hypothetical protein [unclassified Mesorhizobium]MCA0025504.1 hypothetical protein [Mesorhizobium sp. B263B1A]
MKPRLANPVLADRGARLAGVGFAERLVPRQVGAIDCEFPNAQRPSTNDEPSPQAGPQAQASLAGTGSRTLADREGRIEGEAASADLPAISSPSQETWPAAEVSDLRASAAFSHFTESSFALRASEAGSCPVSPHVDGQALAPAVNTPAAGAPFNAIVLPDHVMVLVRAIAAYERCGNERAVALALTEYATLIGAGALARAVADLGDELADVPRHARAAANRFRSGGP